MSNLTRNTITSMEVAEMVGKEHKELLRDIRRYVAQLAESKIALGDFFTEATYKDANNQIKMQIIKIVHAFRSQRKAVSS